MNGVDQNYIPRSCEKITWDKTGIERTKFLRNDDRPDIEAHLALLQKKYEILECTTTPKIFSTKADFKKTNHAERTFREETKKCPKIIKYLSEHPADKTTSSIEQKLLQDLQQHSSELNCDRTCAWDKPTKTEL